MHLWCFVLACKKKLSIGHVVLSWSLLQKQRSMQIHTQRHTHKKKSAASRGFVVSSCWLPFPNARHNKLPSCIFFALCPSHRFFFALCPSHLFFLTLCRSHRFFLHCVCHIAFFCTLPVPSLFFTLCRSHRFFFALCLSHRIFLCNLVVASFFCNFQSEWKCPQKTVRKEGSTCVDGWDVLPVVWLAL